MSKRNIIRAWKDPVYRASLSASERANIPAHPAGMIELEAAELTKVAGGALPYRHPLSTLESDCPKMLNR